MSESVEEDKVEEQEIQKRKTSIIIHGLAESQFSAADERRQEDEDTVEHLLHSLNLDDISVKNVIRLGKRPESTDAKPRPIKLVVASEKQKVRVLSKSKNLPRQKDGGATSIFMHQDLTLKQRAKRQELVKELKDRQAKGEKNLMIVNLRIVDPEHSSRKPYTKNGLKCMYTNLDCFCNKRDELIARIDEIKPDIIGLTEVNPKSTTWEPTHSELEINGYTLFCIPR